MGMVEEENKRPPKFRPGFPQAREPAYPGIIIRNDKHSTAMPCKVIETPYPLIDADPHASRVIRYLRPSDYAIWLGATGTFPAALYFWGS